MRKIQISIFIVVMLNWPKKKKKPGRERDERETTSVSIDGVTQQLLEHSSSRILSNS